MQRSALVFRSLVGLAGISLLCLLACDKGDPVTGNNAATPIGAISGTITTGGQPLKGAMVNYYGTDGNMLAGDCLTDSLGHYTTEKLAPGAYRIFPYCYGYAFSPQESTVTLVDADYTGLDFVATIDVSTIDTPAINRLFPLETTDFMQIDGSFGSDSAHATVTVGGVAQTITAFSQDRITCTLPVSGAGSFGDVIVSSFGKASKPVALTSWRGRITYTVWGPDQVLGQFWYFDVHMRGDIHNRAIDNTINFSLDCDGQVAYQGDYDDRAKRASWTGHALLTHTLRAANPLTASYYGSAKIRAADPGHLWFNISGNDDTNKEQMWEWSIDHWDASTPGYRQYMVPTKGLTGTDALSSSKELIEPASISADGVIAAHSIAAVEAYIINAHLTDWAYTEEISWGAISPE